MPAKNLQLVAKWEANINTPYTVNHYLENLAGTWYDTWDTEVLTGTTDTQTAAAPKHYPWYTSTFDTTSGQVNIDGDGSAVVNIYYDRDTYKIIYRMMWGDPIATGYAKFDADLQPILSGIESQIHRTWYDFHKWNWLPTNGKMPSNDLVLTADWTARDDTPYHVEHYLENIEEEVYTWHETEDLVWTTDTEARPIPKQYTWFRPVESTKTGNIAPDGSLVIKYYYNRVAYTLTYDVKWWDELAHNPIPVRYGVTINTWVTTQKTWYIFSGWDLKWNETMPAHELTIDAQWKPRPDTKYHVIHYYLDIQGDRDQNNVYTGELTGTTDATITAWFVPKVWFDNPSASKTWKIAPDGSLVIEYEYPRHKYTLDYNEEGGVELPSKLVIYEDNINPSSTTRTGYTFSGWLNLPADGKMPANDLTLRADWINNTYTVSFNANQWQWTTQSLTATYDRQFTLTANAFTRTGYTFSGWAMSANGEKVFGDEEVVTQNLASNSGAEVTLYAIWDLDTYSIKYNLNWGSVAWNNPTRYDVNSWDITLINPTRVWYTFAGWTGTDLVSASQNVTITSGSVWNREYTATWQAITYYITYDANSWTLADNPSEYTIESPTITISNPSRVGYTFVWWSGTDLDEPSDNVVIVNGSIWDRHYVANWEARNDIQYRVEHYKEKLDSSYELVASETLYGTTDEETEAVAKTYSWFEVQSFSQAIVNPETPVTVEIYYNRKYYNVTVEGERGILSVLWTWSYKYEQPVTVTVNVKSGYTIDGLTWGHKDYNVVVALDGNVITPIIDVITYNISYELDLGVVNGSNPTSYNVETWFTLINPTRTGYHFAGWTGTDLTTKIMVVTVDTWSIWDRHYVANWTARNDTEYTVIHVYEWIEAESIPAETDTKTHTWTSDTTVTGQLVPRTWFTSPTERTVYIEADGSAELTYNYERTKYTVTYDSNWWIDVNSWTGKFGATIPRPELSRDWYRFDGWSWATRVPAENTWLVAQWTALDVNYVVKHLKQNANDNNYTEVEEDRQTLTWTTDTNTNVIAKVYSGFKTWVFTNVNINGNGSTVVEVKYDREIYTVTFNSSGGSAVDPITGKYEQNITAPENPVLDGYTFKWWSPSFPSTMPLGGTGLKAIWEANTGTKYTVEHYLPDLSGNYAVEPDYTDELRWTTNTYTQATWRVIAWFTVRDITQEIILWNGNTVVRVEYDRNVYTVTYDANWWLAVAAWTGKFGAEIPNKTTSRSWYDFAGWSWATTVPADDVTVIARWNARSDTEYTVRHLKQNANDNNYTEVEEDRQTLTGTTEQLTDAHAKTYDGFKAWIFENAVISGNGSTVIEIKYDREEYDITFDSSTWTHVDTITARYWATVTRPEDPELSWYDFGGWSPAFPSTMPLGGTGLTAIWNARSDTEYTVKHFFEELSGGYVEDTSYEETLTGTTDTQTNAQHKPVVWFSGLDIEQQNINGNGSTVVEVKYDRKIHTVTYDMDWGTPVVTDKQFKYWATIERPQNIGKSGYTFGGWSGVTIMPDNDVTLEAIWTANTNTKYTVKHHQQNITDDGYTIADTDNKIGTTDTYTAASGKVYQWFTMQSFEQQKIKWDGSTVIDIYYTRNEYTITFETSTWTNIPSISGRYGADVGVVADPELDGYTFQGWEPELPETIPYENITLVAQWTANNDTNYTVEHYLQELDGTYPTVANYTDNKQGTTDTNTDARAMSISWFTAQAFAQTWIRWDETTVVKIYYTRDSYTVSYEYVNHPTWASALPASWSYKYQETVTVANLATAPWYDFVWSRTWTFSMPAENVVITWLFMARDDTSYTVEYYYQQSDGTYSGNATSFTGRVWTTDVTVYVTEQDKIPVENEYIFDASANNVLQWVVNWYGTLVLKVYFKKQFTIRFQPWDKWTFEEEVYTWLDYNVETPSFLWDLNVEHASWYTFSWWNPAVPHNVTENATYVAQWKANTNTPYKVQHLKQNRNNDEYEVADIDNKQGTTDTQTNAKAKTYDGFTLKEIVNVNIDGDGSAIAKVYYTRNEYTITFVTGSGTAVEGITWRYEAPITAPADPTRTWYQFAGWSPAFPETMPLEGETLTALWTANTGTKYQVNHRGQNTWDNNYTTVLTWYLMYGTSDTETIAEAMTFDGFTLKEAVAQKNIEPDGSTVVDIYYTRNEYTITFVTGSGTAVEGITWRYEAPITAPADPTRTWYQFAGWSPAFPETMPLEGETLTALWTANTGTKYQVNHYQENIAWDWYDLIETDVLYGTSDVVVIPETKDYTWFTSPSTETILINPDGTAEISYYYSRNSYNLKIRDRDNVLVDVDVKYGDDIVLPSDPIWTWHTFIRWSNLPADGKMPANALEIAAVWDINSYTLTFDTDGGSEIAPIVQDYGTPIVPPVKPTRDRYHFVRWEPEVPETMPDYDMIIKAIWERNGRSGWGWHGWSRWSDEHGSGDDQNSEWTWIIQPDVDPEVLAAYQWAYKHGITTIEWFENANPDWLIPRWHMAKMVTNFAINVLWREIPSEIPAECSWWDTDWESEEIKDYAVKACALWVMWIYMKDFLPNKILDRAELWTIISRLLWWDKYNVIDTNNRPYYVEHLKELKNEWIMTQIQNPEVRKELRKWAWVMLMRVQQ